MVYGGEVNLHLIVDMRGADYSKLADQVKIECLLLNLIDDIEMKQILPMQSIKYTGSKSHDWGITATVVVAESNITFHTFPEHHLVNIDIFSCKGFDEDKALKRLEAYFEPEVVKVVKLKRGLEFDPYEKIFDQEKLRVIGDVVYEAT